MDCGNSIDPLDVKAKGVRGALPGEEEAGPLFGSRLWPARVRLRMMGVLLPVCAAVIAVFSLFVASLGHDVLRAWGGGWLLFSLAVCLVGFVGLGALLYASTSTLRAYRRRLVPLKAATLALAALCVLGFLGIRDMHGKASLFPLAVAFVFLLVSLVLGSERRALKAEAAARGGEGGGSDVL